MDSDTVVLRSQIIHAAEYMQKRQAELMGQIGYKREAHISCLLMDMKATNEINARFVHGGSPSRSITALYRGHKRKIINYPFRSRYYMLHIGCGTRKVIKEIGDTQNEWYDDPADCNPWYHADPLAPIIHDEFIQIFTQDVPKLTPDAVVRACLKDNLIELDLPDRAPLPDNMGRPIARGREIIAAEQQLHL
jgi:hypothetical protein